MVVWNARHLSDASELDRMHGKPLPGGTILMGKGGPAAVTRDLFAFQFGLCAALYEATWVPYCGRQELPARVCRAWRDDGEAKADQAPSSIPYLPSYHKAAEDAHKLVVQMYDATHSPLATPRVGAQAGVARDDSCCQ